LAVVKPEHPAPMMQALGKAAMTRPPELFEESLTPCRHVRQGGCSLPQVNAVGEGRKLARGPLV